MRSKKIVQSAILLDVYARNAFMKFLQSPYFNSNQAAVAYFDIIDQCIRSDAYDLSDEALWARIFGIAPYQHQKFLKLNSDLVKLLEQFLTQEALNDAPTLASNLRLRAAHKMSMEPLMNGILSEFDRLIKQDNNQSGQYYYNRYELELLRFNTKSENEKKKSKFEIEGQLNIEQISSHLDTFYFIEKLRMYCTLLSWKKMYKVEMEIPYMDFILEESQTALKKEIPAVQLYYVMQNTYINQDDTAHYFELRRLMKESLHLFPEEEAKEIYSTAISYCINQVNKGNFSFQRETFELYKSMLTETDFAKTFISVTDFRNIAQIAIRVNESDWAEDFIHNYASFLDVKDRDNAVYFSLARLEFNRNNYDRAIQNLNKVTYEDVWYSLGSKALLLHCYYELNEYDALESLLQSFNMYVRREKSLTKDRKLHQQNLIRFTGSLIKLTSKDKNKLVNLEKEIQETRGVVSKPWLLEKVQEKLQG